MQEKNQKTTTINKQTNNDFQPHSVIFPKLVEYLVCLVTRETFQNYSISKRSYEHDAKTILYSLERELGSNLLYVNKGWLHAGHLS